MKVEIFYTTLEDNHTCIKIKTSDNPMTTQCVYFDNDDLPKLITSLTHIQKTIQAARDTVEVLKEVEPQPMNNFKREYECDNILSEPTKQSTKQCRVLKARDEYYNAIHS